MKNKKNKKKKVLKIFIFILLLISFIYYLFNLKVKNIYIFGNNYLTDQEIIELSYLSNYPKLFKYSSRNISSKIKLSPFIKNVSVKKNLFGKVMIEVEEYNFLLKNELDNSIYISSGEKLFIDENIVGIPSLINYTEPDILNNFLKKITNIDKNILNKISEIEYSPNEYDSDLFIFYMNDGNYVYITTTRLLNINKYIEIVESIGNKKGILYLDSGNHFVEF